MKILILCLFLVACSAKKEKIHLVKQWHLSPATSTENIEQAKNLPHFTNQKDIFLWAKDKVSKGESKIIIAEGCEGELKVDFAKKFNSWTMKELIAKRKDQDFEDILAPVPMKLKALFPKLKVVCGDNEDLIKANLVAASEMRGFFGFYSRLLAAKKEGRDEVYLAYSKKIESLYPNLGNVDKLEFTKNKLKAAIESFESILLDRNDFFLKAIKKHKQENPILIIGGLHVKDLSDSLNKEKIEHEVIVPKGYDNSDQSLLKNLKAIFNSNKISFFMVPQNFMLNRFNFSSQLPPFADQQTLGTLRQLTKNNDLPYELILSDYDKDGIRDFTLSTSSERIIISAEDQDWDNDGIHNLIDEDLAATSIAKLTKKTPFVNNYLTKIDEKSLLQQSKRYFALIQEEGRYHEVLILEVILQLKNKIKLNLSGIKFIQSANLVHSYGKNSFFQYTAVSETLSYDTEKLYQYIKSEFARFTKYDKNISFKKFINSYVIPLLIHSLSHEIAHSLEMDLGDYLKEKGWSWRVVPVKNEYLSKNRHVKKVLTFLKKEVKFKEKSYSQWLDLARSTKNPLIKFKIPSLYSLSKPEEWFAEMYAMCSFLKAYPNSANESERYEKLLGINPAAAQKHDCENYGL